jgi:hypothetical protein
MIAVIGTIAIVAGAITIGLVLDRKLGILPRPEKLLEQPKPKQITYGAGEAAAVAIRAGTAQIGKVRESQRCTACRAPMTTAGEDAVQYNHRRLIVLTFQCSSCSAKRALYVDPV